MNARLAATVLLVSTSTSTTSVFAAPTTIWGAGSGHVTFDGAKCVVLETQSTAADRGPGSAATAGQAHRLFDVKLWSRSSALQSTLLDPAGWVLDAGASSGPDTFVYSHAAAKLSAVLTANETADALLLTLTLRTMPGASNVTLAEVAFPQLSGVRATGVGEPGNRAELVTGGGVRGTGVRIMNPAQNLSSSRLTWYETMAIASPGVSQDAYPHAGTNWIALADPSAALYVGVHDPTLTLTSLRLWNNTAGCSTADGGSFCLSLTANSSAALGPEIVWTRTVALSVVRAKTGSTSFAHWARAAQIYRAWTNAAFPPPQFPAWATGGAPIMGIDASTDAEFFGERETEVDDPWWFGASHLIVCGTSAVPQCCPGYPIPDPGRGGAQGLQEYASRLHSYGMTFGTYFESQRVNPVFSEAHSFRGCDVESLPEAQRPPPLSTISRNAKRPFPGAEGALPGNLAELAQVMDKQTGSYADVLQYFALEDNHTELHVLYPVHNDVAGWFSDYLAQWMSAIGSVGVDAPYLDQLGSKPETPDFGPVWGDGTAGARVYKLLKQGGRAAGAFARSSRNGSWGFTYELYTDMWSQAGGVAMLSGHRVIPCYAICSPSVPHRCDLCDEEWPWLDRQFGDPLGVWNVSKGLTADWEVTRATFPHHAIFEGLNNIPMVAPLAIRVIGKGYIDGHVPDLYSAGNGQAFGMVSPIAWVRQAVSPWLDDPSTEYRYDEGVVSTFGEDTEVRQHRSDSQGWAMFTVFSPQPATRHISLTVADSDVCAGMCRWYTLSGAGTGVHLQACEGRQQCVVPVFSNESAVSLSPSFAAAVLVVADSSSTETSQSKLASRPAALTLVRTSVVLPAVTQVCLTICNVEPRTLLGQASVANWQDSQISQRSGTSTLNATVFVPYSVPPHACVQVMTLLNLTNEALPKHLVISAPGVVGGLRRLAPVPVADPHFTQRRFAGNVVPRPHSARSRDASDRSGEVGSGPYVMLLDVRHQAQATRNIYWPSGAAGTMHLRFFAVAPNTAGESSLPLSIGLESWRRDGNGTYQHQFPRCTATAPLGVWSSASIPLWEGGGAADGSWLLAKFSLTGFAGADSVLGSGWEGRAYIDVVEVTAAGVVPRWQQGLQVLHC